MKRENPYVRATSKATAEATRLSQDNHMMWKIFIPHSPSTIIPTREIPTHGLSRVPPQRAPRRNIIISREEMPYPHLPRLPSTKCGRGAVPLPSALSLYLKTAHPPPRPPLPSNPRYLCPLPLPRLDRIRGHSLLSRHHPPYPGSRISQP